MESSALPLQCSKFDRGVRIHMVNSHLFYSMHYQSSKDIMLLLFRILNDVARRWAEDNKPTQNTAGDGYISNGSGSTLAPIVAAAALVASSANGSSNRGSSASVIGNADASIEAALEMLHHVRTVESYRY